MIRPPARLCARFEQKPRDGHRFRDGFRAGSWPIYLRLGHVMAATLFKMTFP
jgi:hypothetical protein